jgi:transcriptional regulator
MYLPEHFTRTDVATLHRLIRDYPLATLVTLGDGELIVNHVPLLIDAGAGPYGMLRGHVARANPVWRHFSAAVPTTAVFRGPDAYVSPSWYPSKAAHGKVVPTWNYAVVHAHGMPRVIEDRDWLRALVEELTTAHEAAIGSGWKFSDAPADFAQQMLGAIVGIEIPITTLTGKWKVSQNRTAADRAAVAAALGARGASGDSNAAAMAELVRRSSEP